MTNDLELAEEIVEAILTHLSTLSYCGALEEVDNETYDQLEEDLVKIVESKLNDKK